jgi:hypothetical protein
MNCNRCWRPHIEHAFGQCPAPAIDVDDVPTAPNLTYFTSTGAADPLHAAADRQRFYAVDLDRVKAALELCLDALVREIPEVVQACGLEQITDDEADAAIEAATFALYGEHPAFWPDDLHAAVDHEHLLELQRKAQG